jgi:hypothetical protein
MKDIFLNAGVAVFKKAHVIALLSVITLIAHNITNPIYGLLILILSMIFQCSVSGVLSRLITNGNSAISDYIDSLKQYLGKYLILGIIISLVFYFISGVFIVLTNRVNASITNFVNFLVTLLLTIGFIFIYPVLFRFNHSVKKTLTLSFECLRIYKKPLFLILPLILMQNTVWLIPGNGMIVSILKPLIATFAQFYIFCFLLFILNLRENSSDAVHK